MSVLHTPGPWIDIGTMQSTDDPHNGERFIVQALNGLDYGYVVGCALPCGDPDSTPERTLANARLIASAPELLEVLERLVCVFGGDDYEHFASIQSARQVIAKATGKQP